jgi:hypothetical protein
LPDESCSRNSPFASLGIVIGLFGKNQAMKKFVLLIAGSLMILFFITCNDDNPEKGSLTFHFQELADYNPLVVDSMKYTNEAGNEYLITEVQFFISNLKIHYQDGLTYSVAQDEGIHYVDSDIPETHTWEILEEVPVGTIDSISFTFGMNEDDNISGRFADPPESYLFWPDELGGGYHYMKLNGKWLTTNSDISPFNFHLGIGQTYDTTGQVTGFIHNHFRVNCFLAIYSSYIAMVEADKMNHLAIGMDITSWFTTPHTWDFDNMGGMMMQNQEAQEMAAENGFDVFFIAPNVN